MCLAWRWAIHYLVTPTLYQKVDCTKIAFDFVYCMVTFDTFKNHFYKSFYFSCKRQVNFIRVNEIKYANWFKMYKITNFAGLKIIQKLKMLICFITSFEYFLYFLVILGFKFWTLCLIGRLLLLEPYHQSTFKYFKSIN